MKGKTLMSIEDPADPVFVDSILLRYVEHVRAALHDLNSRNAENHASPFAPAGIAEKDALLQELFAASGASIGDMGRYGGKRWALLDLMHNPRTRTTKTYPSLVLVARAVEHIQRTGERLMIVTPSSANKATALRDAVLRAIECGLVSPAQLQILSVVPHSSRDKLWSSELSDDPELARCNPVATYDGPDTDGVKALARGLVDDFSETLWRESGVRLWHTMDIENYKAADVVRAHLEHEFIPLAPGRTRLHVHAVSSGFGLLGHDLGMRQLAADQSFDPAVAHYFLVQHLGTPDMVLSLYRDDQSREGLPKYVYDERQGVHRQDHDPHFPYTTFATDEVLDATFYTRRPTTSEQMNHIIRERGGGGIVVSLHECLSRYGQVSALVNRVGISLPADPRALREWSLVMAMTGILNAVDRGLVGEDEILVHGSGSYSTSDYRQIREDLLTPANSVGDLVGIVGRAVQCRSR